jgi:hypothetical protein
MQRPNFVRMHPFLVFFQWLVFQITSLRGQQTAFITDLPAFSSLAPCASVAVTEAFNSIGGDCPTNVALTISASCACLKNQNSALLSTGISTQMTFRCGSTATDDVTSALNVFSAYCAAAQSITPTIPSITQIVYVTELSALNLLAPCASVAVTEAFNSIGGDCPTNAAPSLSASCACVKDQNSALLSTGISTQMAFRCGSTATEDVTSGLDLLSAYCAPFVAAAATTEAEPGTGNISHR